MGEHQGLLPVACTAAGRRKPLKIGIDRDKPEGLFDPKTLRLAFRVFTNNHGYLRSTRLGVPRIDLDGNPAGVVNEAEVRSAQARLNGIWKFRKDMKRQRREEAAQAAAPEPVPAPPPRDSLSALRDAAKRRRGAVQS